MSTYEVAVSAAFSARHAAATPGGQLERPHRHRWRIEAAFRSDGLTEEGFVVDFLAVRGALEQLAAELAGADLNLVVPGPGGASAERLAQFLADRLADRLHRPVHRLTVTEAPGCRAMYYPAGPA